MGSARQPAESRTGGAQTSGVKTPWRVSEPSEREGHRRSVEESEREDAANLRETMNAVVAEYDKIGAGELARQCIDASRIVQIAENPSGWREILFLFAGLASLLAALFITKMFASMFKVEIAQLMWIPIAACIALLVGLFAAIHSAKKHKVAIAAGVALSAAGVVSLVDPVRHAFFGVVANAFAVFTAWYVPIAGAAISIAGLLFVFTLLCRQMGGGLGSVGAFVLRNAIGLVAIPGVCAFLFLAILSIVDPWLEDRMDELASPWEEGMSDADTGTSWQNDLGDNLQGMVGGEVPFSAFSEEVRKTAAEMARATEGVYDGTLPRGATPFNGFLSHPAMHAMSPSSWNWRNGTFTTQSGLVAQVFSRSTGSHGSEMMVVFRGTASAKDGLEDWRQLFGDGFAPQYAEAAALVRAVRATTDLPVVVLGHSLGGGQTQYAVAMNQGSDEIRGVGFNPAGLSANSLGDIEGRRGEGDSVRAARFLATVRLDNDPVSTAGVLLGRVVVAESGGVRGTAAHSIATLAKSMERFSK